MAYRTRYGSHYHMTQGCHGADIPCGTAGLSPCSDCCGTGGGAIPTETEGAAGVVAGAGACMPAPPSPVTEEAAGDAGQVATADVRRAADASRLGAEAMTGDPACPDSEDFAEGELAGHLAESHKAAAAVPIDGEEAPRSPEDEFQRRWRAQYNRVVPQAADLTYESCVLTVEETGEFPDFEWMFDAVTHAMRDSNMMRGTEWMADTGFGFGYARALVECRGRCDVSEGVRAIAEYMGFDDEEELRELGIAV